MSEPHNRLPEPPSPEALAVVHVYRACCYLVDALLEDGIEDCQEYHELHGALFAARMIATSIECSIHVHPAVRKAQEAFLLKWIKLDKDSYEEPLFPREVFERVTPSTN